MEIIEEHRAYDSDISLETIFGKCRVICGNVEDSANGLLQNLTSKTSLPIFVCRYKFLKVQKVFQLIPLQESPKKPRRRSTCRNSVDSSTFLTETEKSTPVKSYIKTSPKKKYTPMPLSERKRLESLKKKESTQYQNSSEKENKLKVTPIKIIGRNSVIKTPSNSTKKYEVNANYLPNSPICNNYGNSKITSKNKIISARRNLNKSLKEDNDDDFNMEEEEDYFNYSIVDNSLKESEMKLKLRLSQRYV